MIELEKRGVPTAYVATREFVTLAKTELEALGMPSLPVVVIPHPMDRMSQSEVWEVAERCCDEIIQILTQPAAKLAREYRNRSYAAPTGMLPPKPVLSGVGAEVKATVEEASLLYYSRGWTDGLPIVPPTRAAVDKMLEYTDRDPDEVIAVLLPRQGKATVEKIAVNAVMAGCLPRYLPVIVAAVQGMAEDQFNLAGLIATTNPAGQVVLVNGPIAKELEINCGYGLFGPGWMSNATIGRAVRLVVTNIAGGTPGIYDRSTLGQPGKYTFCFAENEEQNPWQPLHVERGFTPEVSTVTMFGGTAPQNIVDYTSQTVAGLMTRIAQSMAAPGNNNITASAGEPLLVLGPEHAATIAQAGFSKDGVKRFMYEHAVSTWPEDEKHPRRKPGQMVRTIAERPEDIMIMVAGGGGPHSAYVASFFESTRSVTKAITFKDGTPVKSVEQFRTGRR